MGSQLGVGIVAPHGSVEIIPGPSGRLLPSQVAFQEDGSVLVGEAAFLGKDLGSWGCSNSWMVKYGKGKPHRKP